jgi:hypothetical protein
LKLKSEIRREEITGLLIPGDFDGDGIIDLLGASRSDVMVSYLGENFKEDATVDLFFSRGTAPMAAGHLTDDQAADVAFADLFGVGVVRGTQDRQLSGTVYPTYSVPLAQIVIFAADTTANFAGDEALAVIDLPDPTMMRTGATVVQVDLGIQATPRYFLTDANALPSLDTQSGNLGPVATGRLDPSKPCEQYVLAFPDKVFVGTPCESSGKINGQPFDPGAMAPPKPVPIPLLSVDLSRCLIQIDRAFVVDADADGKLDLVLAPKGPAGAQPCLVRGPINFGEPPVPPTPIQAEPYGLFVLQQSSDQPPVVERALQIAHLNPDTVPDLVSSWGIFSSQTGPCAQNLIEHPSALGNVHLCTTILNDPMQNSGRSVSAAVGDVNGDGLPDVAVARQLNGESFVYAGRPDGTFSEFVVEAHGYPGQLALGDLDGDGLDDLMFADRSCFAGGQCIPNGDPSDILSVAFGRVSGGPEEPRELGRLGNIEALIVAKFPSLFGGIDGTSDLGVLTHDPVDQTLNLSVLRGSTQRQLQTPFFLYVPAPPTDPLGDEVFLPVNLALGRFAERDATGASIVPVSGSAHLDIAVAAFSERMVNLEPKVRLWLLDSEGEAKLSVSREWPSAEVGDWSDHNPAFGALAAANLDADVADELVYASGHGLAVADVQVETSMDGKQHPVFVPVSLPIDVSVRSLVAAGLRQQPGFDRDGALPIPLQLSDLDGDGQTDIAVAGKAMDGTMRALVLWNDQGLFDPTRATAIDLPADTAAFVLMNLDEDPSLELLVAAGRELTLYDGRARGLVSLGSPPGLEAEAAPILRMASADFDGDGVPDLALGHLDFIELFRSVPKNESP